MSMVPALVGWTTTIDAAASTGSAAIYTLLGAGIAAVASLLAVLIKAWLDGRAERQKHNREMAKLDRELAAARNERIIERRQELFAETLVATHAIYDDIRVARRRRRKGDTDDLHYVAELRAISTIECQGRIEEVRLIGSPSTTATADELWHHLRSEDVPRGAELAGKAWVSWKDQYWTIRRRFIQECKGDLQEDVAGDGSGR